jgi:hypothetical protein
MVVKRLTVWCAAALALLAPLAPSTTPSVALGGPTDPADDLEIPVEDIQTWSNVPFPVDGRMVTVTFRYYFKNPTVVCLPVWVWEEAPSTEQAPVGPLTAAARRAPSEASAGAPAKCSSMSGCWTS